MIVRDELPKLNAALRALTANRVLVGIPAEDALRRPDPDEGGPPINNAALLYIHEHGAPEANIPARPSLFPGIATVQGEINKRFETCARDALAGKTVNVTRTLTIVGLIAQNAVKAKITEGPFIPLAPATLAARRRKGRTGERPLIDTGQMRNAVTFVIRPANALSHA